MRPRTCETGGETGGVETTLRHALARVNDCLDRPVYEAYDSPYLPDRAFLYAGSATPLATTHSPREYSMRRFVFGLVLLTACGTAVAQQQSPPGLPTPRIQHVFPPGAKAGPAPKVSHLGLEIVLDTELTVTGTDLDEPENLLFSHPGIKARIPRAESPAARSQEEGEEGRRRRAGPGHTSSGSRLMPAFRRALTTCDSSGSGAISNPRAFVVGDRNEVNEKEPNNDVPEAQRVPIGTTVNGVIASPTDVDYTIFTGKKGQRVLLSCLAASIDSRASPLIEVYDPSGRKLAHNRGYRDNDALADLFIPADGEYFVRLSQFAYQGGGPDHFYRLTISSGPVDRRRVPAGDRAGKGDSRSRFTAATCPTASPPVTSPWTAGRSRNSRSRSRRRPTPLAS